MKKMAALLAFAFLYLFVMPDAAFAQRGSGSSQVVEVRLASPLPRNSDWGRALDRIAADWARVTNNEVRLRIIHDGVEGGEAKMLSSLNANNIQAGLFVSSGLYEICPAVMNLSVPFQIKSEEELNLVLNDALPVLNAQISKTNFAVVAWSKGGWVNIFSKEPVVTPDDLRRQKLAATAEQKDLNVAIKSMGFSMVETELIDVGMKLANNMISAVYLTPVAVAPLGLHKNLKNMLDLPIAPFMAAIVINRVTWNKISADRQRELIRVTQRVADEFDVVMLRTVDNAVSAMSRDGLKVNRPSPAQEELWYTEISKVIPSLIGTTFDRDLYQQITRTLEKSRSAAAADAQR